MTDNTQKVLVEVNEALEIGVDHWAGAMAWSPDGKEIAYLLRDKSADKSDPAELWVVSASGGPPRRIARAPVSHPQLRELKWHPNGKAIYARGAAPDAPGGGFQHWVLENFLPKPEVAQAEQ